MHLFVDIMAVIGAFVVVVAVLFGIFVYLISTLDPGSMP